jgi:hypothetical protein
MNLVLWEPNELIPAAPNPIAQFSFALFASFAVNDF